MIDLDPGDVVVAAVPTRDFILVFCRSGAVYKVVYRDTWDHGPEVTVYKL